MKFLNANPLALLACAMPLAASAQGPALDRPPMRVAPTNEQLVLQLRQARQEEADRPAPQAPPSQDATTLERPADLISRSEILCFRGYLTLVPKRAVLQYPEQYADRLKPVQGAKIQTFPQFLAANRNWISTFEVSRAQAQGKDPLEKDARANMSKTGNLIIATFQGNPIEVMPLVLPEVAADGTKSQPSKSQP